MKVFLNSIGCRLNQSEIETMARQLLAAGHEIVTESAKADKVIINTCAVTAEAARDARSQTRRIHRQNPDAEIVLTGCYATIASDELSQVQGAGRVVVNQQKAQLVQLLDPKARIELPVFEQEPVLREFLAGGLGANTRAFIKVQDGCDNKCTFCVTTVARGTGQSRHLGDVVAEIQALTAAGYQEAVLTGVHLGSYGHDFGNRAGLLDLVQAILRHTDIPRLRLSSLEPWDLVPDFFTLWQNPRLLPHLHMPLQSGSDKILKRMARRTSCASFRELAEAARSHISNLNLSTDVIVGFPGETAADFADSLEFVEEINFSRLHVFGYSPRPGTAASQFPNQINGKIKKERTRRMINLGKELSHKFHRRFVGQTLNVLWETNVGADNGGLRWVGYTDNYIRVQANGPADLFNQVTPTKIVAAFPNSVAGFIGEPVSV
ncbi:tRNA (N(6)-L-threonylcarbamoyladenosine(37)-C(2))-methylthiotransferase MtaB [Candidatus Leptofilum sp.]|uniref:tRNA (N(6)-L-threonylcarbamoyladenosine(37)-C(2))- methylthiotransferase MtaB n=1 Tax=Candidatus Leptofilum sp. TaxID=3241576 RepID=UPI003B5983CA